MKYRQFGSTGFKVSALGMGSLKMLEENRLYAGRSEIDMLSPADNKLLSRIVEIYQKEILVPCTACNYCMPCPFGVNIPQTIKIPEELKKVDQVLGKNKRIKDVYSL